MEIKDSTGEIRGKNATKVTVGCLLPQCTTSSLGMGCTGPLGPGLAPNELKYKKKRKKSYFFEKKIKKIFIKPRTSKKKTENWKFSGKIGFFWFFFDFRHCSLHTGRGLRGVLKKGGKKNLILWGDGFFIVRNHYSGVGDLKFEFYPEGLVKEKR